MIKLKQVLKRFLKFILPGKIRLFLRKQQKSLKEKIRSHRINTNIKIKKRQTLEIISVLEPLVIKNKPQYIVSLTSYGKRLTITAPYAIITLFNQIIKPDRIILWLTHEDKKNIPAVMKKLTAKGLEIRFCEDVKSYNKLIPSLENFPDDYIITADDDIYYPQTWFEQLITEHKKNPKKIICHRAHGIKVDENYNPLSYVRWDYYIEPASYFRRIFLSQEQDFLRHQFECIFPTGVGGILYPPQCLYKDVSKKELFIKLAPHADDVWFWAMAVINKEYFKVESPYTVIKNGYSRNLQLIEPEQENGMNSLQYYNVSQNKNDIQLNAVIEQYPQIREYIKRISSEVFRSDVYWEERYLKEENSGAGSYGRLAQFKADILNNFVKKYSINSVMEFGCGDGNQLSLAHYPKYLGFDVSHTAISTCKCKFLGDKTKEFRLLNDFRGETADLVLSLDVIYHLIEDDIFEKYMERLFCASGKFVIIYSSNKMDVQHAQHVKHRKFTDWIEKNKGDWRLLQFIPNKYPAIDNGDDPSTSFADFYIFGNQSVVSLLNKREKISILVPVYNTEKYLRECLDSLINQTYKNIEIICVNDASTDNSLEILNEYARKDDRIIIINKILNEGLPQARKTGFENSKGKYITFVDSDDWIELDIVEKLYYCAIFNEYDVLCCGYFEERQNSSSVFNPQIISENKTERIKYGTFGFGNAKVVWNKFVKRAIYEKIIFPKESNGEDCFITAQLFYYADELGYYPLPLYHWQFNENSLTNNVLYAKKRYEDRKANYEHIIDFCKKNFGNDMNVFEPELSARMTDIESQKPTEQ